MDEQREEILNRLREVADVSKEMNYHDLACILYVAAGAAHDSPVAMFSLATVMTDWASKRLKEMGDD